MVQWCDEAERRCAIPIPARVLCFLGLVKERDVLKRCPRRGEVQARDIREAKMTGFACGRGAILRTSFSRSSKMSTSPTSQ